MINRYSVMLNENRVPYLKLDESIKYDGENRLQTPKLVVDLVNTVFELEDCLLLMEFPMGVSLCCFSFPYTLALRDLVDS